jgi:integrase
LADGSNVYGFRTHAFRHIVATAWLKAYPRDYFRVATLLHDSLDVVIKTCGHITPDDGMSE